MEKVSPEKTTDKRMKILVLANDDGGLYSFRKELLQELINDGDTVYLSLPEGEFIPLLEAMGGIFCETLVDRRGMNPFKDMRLVLRYDRLVRTIRPDVVLTYTIKPNIYGGIVCRMRHVKYIANITGLGTAIERKGLLSGILLFLYKIGLKDAAQVFFQNETNRFFFREKKLVGRSRLLPGSGVNLEEHRYEEYPEESEETRFLYVGRIMKEKGVGELLNGAEKLKKCCPDLSFDLAGGYDEGSFRNRIEELERKGIIRYLGERKDIHFLMKACHALILPSYHEGLSNVLLEAAACGRPVLATDVPGCRETFEDGVSGIAFRPKDSVALVSAVEKFLDLPYEEKRQMGVCGRRKVEREFDRRIVTDAYMQEIKGAHGGAGNTLLPRKPYCYMQEDIDIGDCKSEKQQ